MKRLNLALGGLAVDDSVCINLKNRSKRKAQFKREAKKKALAYRFYPAVEDKQYPNLGKFESHLRCILQAKKAKCRSTLIMEDDCKVLTSRFQIPPPPVQWDMLYLGGNIQRVTEDEDTKNSQIWKRCCCLMCHAYVVNSSAYDLILEEGFKLLKETREKSPEEQAALNIDEWYCTVIHPQLKAYITIPERVIQRDGWSDVKGKEVTYRQQLTGGIEDGCVAPATLAKPVMEQFQDENTGALYGRIKLSECPSDDDLPEVALLTCVHNQADLFQFIQWSYYNIDYPRNKMTWIIVDDSAHEDKVSPLVDGSDLSIKYVNCSMGSDSGFLAIAKKYNIAMTYLPPHTQHVLVYSPDCYYPPDHVRSRVRMHLEYPQYRCIGCTKVGVYDVSTNKSWEQHTLDGRGNQTMLFSPSISFTKDFWAERKFDETQYTMEVFYFVRGRWEEVLDVPYGLVMTALTWDNQRYSETMRYGLEGKAETTTDTVGLATTAPNTKKHKNQEVQIISEVEVEAEQNNVKKDVDGVNFAENWDIETQNVVMMLGRILGSGCAAD